MEHGVFVFRNEGDGCLTSKYMHDVKGPFVECCKRQDYTSIKTADNDNPNGVIIEEAINRVKDIDLINNPFWGHYLSVFIQGTPSVADMFLIIAPQISNASLFDFIWYERTSPFKIHFKGVGMMFEKTLVGTYWKNI